MDNNNLIAATGTSVISMGGALVGWLTNIEPILRTVSMAISILAGLITIVIALVGSFRKKAADGKITTEEIVELAEEARDGLQELSDKTKEWSERE